MRGLILAIRGAHCNVRAHGGRGSQPLSSRARIADPGGPLPRSERVVAVMPAYNAAKTVERTLRDIPEGAVDEIILVDDSSKDDTVAVTRALGLTTIVHPEN